MPTNFENGGYEQVWYFRNKEQGTSESRDESFGRGVLIRPLASRNEQQKIMILVGLIRVNPGQSNKRLTRNDFAHLRDVGAIEQRDGKWLLRKPAVFPNLSRAAGLLSLRSTNGWQGWESLDSKGSLSELHARADFSLACYEAPDDAIEVPAKY